jgi:hypothetical protein
MLSMHNDHVKAGHPGCFLFRMTPCEIGLCGNCEKGNHARCGTRTRIEDPRPWDPKPEINWNLSVGGDGPYGKAAALLPNCKGWLCPCGCWKIAKLPVPEQPAEPAPRPIIVVKPRKSLAQLRHVITGQAELYECLPRLEQLDGGGRP